jgi:hypothetical protein
VPQLATETKMIRLVSIRVRAVVLAVGLMIGLAAAAMPERAFAQGAGMPKETEPPPAPDDGRYTFHRQGDGFVRLDSRTGQVSQCGWSANIWSCKLLPDERAALESEIARLQRDNAVLKNALLAGGLQLPGGVAAEASPAPPIPPNAVPDASPKEPKSPPPVEAELDRALSFMKTIWRRLIDMMVDLQRDMQRKS